MIIPEDGCLPQITRKGFAAFNNVMLIKVPEKLKKPGETRFQLATLDRSKKGERWPADQYVDIVMNVPTSKDTNSAESCSNSKEDNIPNSQQKERKRGQFRPKKFIPFSKKNQSQKVCHSAPLVIPKNVANFNHSFMPNTFHNSQVSHNGLLGENSMQYNGRTFNDNAHTHRYRPNTFSNDHQPYGGNHLENRYRAHGDTVSATVSREPTIRNESYNNDFDSRNPSNNLMISPPKPPFVDFQRNQPLYPGVFVTNPQDNNFNRPDILNPDFVEMGRCAEPPPFTQNIPNAYGTNNYPNEAPRNGNFEREIFPYNHSNRAEFINNNFNLPPFHDSLKSGLNNGFNNSPMDNPPLLPLPSHPPLPYDNFNDIPNDNFRNNFNRRNPRYGQDTWDDHNQQNSNYHRTTGNERKFNSWRGRRPNKFSKGNNRRPNNRYQRKKSS